MYTGVRSDLVVEDGASYLVIFEQEIYGGDDPLTFILVSGATWQDYIGNGISGYSQFDLNFSNYFCIIENEEWGNFMDYDADSYDGFLAYSLDGKTTVVRPDDLIAYGLEYWFTDNFK